MSKEATAYHEAGHAFVGWLRFRVKEATIKPGADSSGHVVIKTWLRFRSLETSSPSDRRIKRFHDYAVFLLAGWAAQRCYRPNSLRSYHARSDHQKAVDLLDSIHLENEVQAVICNLEQRTAKLVEDPANWFVIEHLARELLKCKKMTGQEVEAAIGNGYALYTAQIGSSASAPKQPRIACEILDRFPKMLGSNLRSAEPPRVLSPSTLSS